MPSARITAILCAAALLLFALLAYFAAATKSPTYDEPLHAVAGWLHLHDRSFVIDPEDPPLFKDWAMLANGPHALERMKSQQLLNDTADDLYHEWEYVVDLLYRTGDNAARSDDFMMRGRAMMVILAVALGGLIAWWGWQLGGSIAAIAAAFLFALDPNFLGHGPLVKNDVPLALVTCGLFLAVWRAGRRMTWLNLLGIGVGCGAALSVKFSGMLLGPVVAVLLLYRAIRPTPWFVLWREFDLVTERLTLALTSIAFVAIFAWGFVWACYGFRFRPTPDPNLMLNVKRMVSQTMVTEVTIANGGKVPDPLPKEEDWHPGLATRLTMTLDDLHFFPQSWLLGFLYTYQSTLARQTFLMGDYSLLGWWYYFPMAMLFKTPLTTLFAMAAAASLAVFAFVKSRPISESRRWDVLCLVLPPAVYLGFAMASHLNLGLRHILAIYPFVYIAVGALAAFAWRRSQRVTKVILIVAAVALAAESFAVFPNYIAYFNVAAGGSRGGLDLLGDSNLDWGQDLKLLAKWQQDHKSTPLYLIYFGIADPWAYGIDYTNFPMGYHFGPKYEVKSEPGVLAVSATLLQGIYFNQNEEIKKTFARLREKKPFEVLGGTIYLYRWPPMQ
jgi:hypothetical protein